MTAVLVPSLVLAQAAQDSLLLFPVAKVKIKTVMNFENQRFTNYIFWEEQPNKVAALIHEPDTSGWNWSETAIPQGDLSVPWKSGAYSGDVDRVVSFRALDKGRIGETPSIRLVYVINNEENWSGLLNIGSDYYVKNEPAPCLFTNEFPPFDTLDLGLNMHFTAGLIDTNGVFSVGLEDFEGFHVWRGIEANGSDLTVLGEFSKQENSGTCPISQLINTGFCDSIYFQEILPAMRDRGRWPLPINVPGLGNELNIRSIIAKMRETDTSIGEPDSTLADNEFMWFDTNTFNGFTYYYTVTTFDRDFDLRNGRQGLIKFDNCQPEQGLVYDCRDQLVSVRMEVVSQNDLWHVYAVPNPYRSGTTQHTTPNYHNFPDGQIRFVNVPSSCRMKIYTVAGDLVRRITHTGRGNIEWDTRNDSGALVTSGIYVWRLETDSGDEVYGRLIIIR
jgi:hypothetical protein